MDKNKRITERGISSYEFINWVRHIEAVPTRDWPAEREAAALDNAKLSEVAIQSRAFINLWNTRPELRGRFFTINNNSENAIKGALNRAMGVLSGVSDMCFLTGDGKSIWIEWKTSTGKQSPAQKEWAATCDKLGHTYVVVENELEFITIINLFA